MEKRERVRRAMELYLVTDRSWLDGRTLEEDVEQALQGGVTLVQLREKHLEKEEFIALAKRIKKVTDQYQVPLIINDDVEVALAVDAAGVHVGQKDCYAKEARKLLGPDKILGVTCNRVELAKEAQANGADYLGVGAVFGSGTKKDAIPLDHAVLQEICQAVDIPVVAIGGINATNAQKLKGRKMDGIAVISGILAAKDIKKAAQELKVIAQDIIK
jgi:thiamine-phosphate pyrophosphorylase